MSGIKSTSIVVRPCWAWSDGLLLEDVASATGLDALPAPCTKWTFPPTTVAYCGMSPSRCVSAIADVHVVNYWSENLRTGAGLSHPFRSQPGGRISRIAEMDWYSIRQVDFGPCCADLTYRWRWHPGKSYLCGHGPLTTWSRPFASMLQIVSEFERRVVITEISPSKSGQRRSGYRSWVSWLSADGTGSILAGQFPAPGVRVSG
jgi:hypothetical protein